MATITKENIGHLHDKLTVTLEKADYLPSFEKVVKDYSRKANIPGFRKGQVPAGLIKKMYGVSLFTDEVLKSVDRELSNYLETDKLQIFAQPLPLEMDIKQLDVNNPADYTFQFEVGVKPEFNLPDWSKTKTIRYKVEVTPTMIDDEISRLQRSYGNLKDEDVVTTEENRVDVTFIEVDANGEEIPEGIKKDNLLLVKHFAAGFRPDLIRKKVGDSLAIDLETAFDENERNSIKKDLGLDGEADQETKNQFKIAIRKIGILESREPNEEFFEQLYPGKEIKTLEALRDQIKTEIEAYWAGQARNQIQDQLYHELIDDTEIEFPEGFLKKWMKTQGENAAARTDEEIEKEFPVFLNQLKWTLITDKIVRENGIQVLPEDLRNFAKQQLFSYMGTRMDEEQPWVNDYLDKMMKDRKFIEDAFSRIQIGKIFEWAETKITPAEKDISADEFTKMVEAHQHHHH
jgi:trigger factor